MSIPKRVQIACDRCRLKKSKCDGARPCKKCQVDNAICIFGVRRKHHEGIPTVGSVDALKEEQLLLVAAVQEMYLRLQTAQAWNGLALPETDGHPLTHDIITALNLLETKHDNTSGPTSSEAGSELIAGSVRVHSTGSSNTDADESGESSPASSTVSDFSLSNCDPRPGNHPPSELSPRLSSPQLCFDSQAYLSTSSQVPLLDGSQLYQAEWARATAHIGGPEYLIGSGFVAQAQEPDGSLVGVDDMYDLLQASVGWDSGPTSYGGFCNQMTSYW
ncbi:Fluconazole resistance protein 1 [Elasticomyces elasticus]|nr:Fluconazole resistance protein 1 [Elasticomyces elasticus]KAK4968840.1 Fluconazole resistance protein 1 [Elasticomyces elasticus]